MQGEWLVIETEYHFVDVTKGEVISKRKNSTITGTPNSRGYIQYEFGGRKILAHHYIYETYHDVKLQPGEQIDHINRDRTDNRISNLRLSNNTRNSQNKGCRIDSKTAVKGVSKTKSGNFVAAITINGSRSYLGTFKDIENAKKAYNRAALKANKSLSTWFKPSK